MTRHTFQNFSCCVACVADNGIEAEGMAALAACLREGAAPKLQMIDLSDNEGVSEEVKQVLEEAREGVEVVI